MASIKQIKIIDPISGNSSVVDLAAEASNISLGTKTLDEILVDYTGATETENGKAGFVPAATSAQKDKFLKGDGTWGVPDASAAGAIPASEKGADNGVATLGADGKVPSTQLPSYVDDVLEAANKAALPTEGEAGKIYVTLDDNKTYRWSGTTYVEISESLALGETNTTAFAGDKGKTAYDHATETRLTTATASGFYKVASTAEGHIASLSAVTKDDITGLGVPAQDTTYTANTANVGSASAWSAGNVASFVINGNVLEITPNTAPSLTITETSVATGISEVTD